MELQIEQLPGGVTRAIPIGRWDINGVARIEPRLNAVAGSGQPLIIDLVQVLSAALRLAR